MCFSAGDPVDFLIDEVILKLSALPQKSVSADALHKPNVQAIVARMWEKGEKYDDVEEVMKTVKVLPTVSAY
jgi:hypothetical protein